MKLGEVQHVNKLSVANPNSQIFCKKSHKVSKVNKAQCEKCPYFVSMGHMDCVICQWKDTMPLGDENKEVSTKVIASAEAQKELIRVSNMIDRKLITKN